MKNSTPSHKNTLLITVSTHSNSTSFAGRAFSLLAILAVVAALYAVSELIALPDAHAIGSDPGWVGHWLIVWLGIAAAVLAVVVPLLGIAFQGVKAYLREQDEQAQFAAMLQREPAFAQEFAAMSARTYDPYELDVMTGITSAMPPRADLDALDGGLGKATLAQMSSAQSEPTIARQYSIGYV